MNATYGKDSRHAFKSQLWLFVEWYLAKHKYNKYKQVMPIRFLGTPPPPGFTIRGDFFIVDLKTYL